MATTTVFRPTVIIGLGGTGYRVLLEFKARLVEVYGKVPPLIRLLSIDTTEDSEKRKEIAEGISVELDSSEIFQISISNPNNVVQFKNVKEWWPTGVNPGTLTKGAGQIRARGRLGLFAESRRIYEEIRKAIGSVRDLRNSQQSFQDEFKVSNTGGVEVFIVGSIAGGTGSGTFLDIAFMVRNESLNNDLSITGVLALPKVFVNQAATINVRSNAYGALKEIEHFWHSQPTEIDYGSKTITVDRPPFDLVFLIDGVNEAGKFITQPKDLQNLMADGLYVLTASQISTESGNAIDNIKASLGNKVSGGRFSANYCSFGVSSLVLPGGNIKQLKLQDICHLIKEDLVRATTVSSNLESEINDLMEDFGIQNLKIAGDLINDKDNGVALNVDFKLGGISFKAGADRQIRERFRNDFNSKERQVSTCLNANYGKVLQRVMQKIEEWWKTNINRKNGIGSCQALMQPLIDRIDEERIRCQTASKTFEEQKNGIQLEAMAVKIHEVTKSFLVNEEKVKRACDDYAKIATQHNKCYLNSNRYSKAAELMGELSAFIGKLINRQEEIQITLTQVLKNFEQDLARKSGTSNSSNLFIHTMQRFNISDMKPDTTYESLTVWQREQGRRVSDWTELTVTELQTEMTAYIDERYRTLSGLSVEGALRQSETEQASEDLKQLWDLACPLWCYEATRIAPENQGTINEFCYIGTANRDTSILNESEIKKRLPSLSVETNIVSTGDLSRITLFRMRAGLPLFALLGIEELKQEYDNPNRAFKHLHKDWVSLPDLIPTDDNDDALECFALGLALNIIKRGLQNYQVSAKLPNSNITKLIELSSDRVKAYDDLKHKKNKELVTAVKLQIDAHLRRMVVDDDKEKVSEFLQLYVNKLSERMEGQMQQGNQINPSLQQQILSEIRIIENYIERINPIF